MKKILGVVGSPRKNGNTHILISIVLEGARAVGAKTELLFLNDFHILECDGCHACWKTQECCKDDDMKLLYPKISDCDALVFGTPVYWYGPTALMKGFLDRFVYFNCPPNRKKIKDKPAALAVPFEEESPETAALTVAIFEKSLAYLQMQLRGKILVPGVSESGDILKKEESLMEAYMLGKRLATELHQPMKGESNAC